MKFGNVSFTHFDLDTEGKVPEHRITGQYRNKSNRIWDPHPQYLIDAFGLHLHLILYQDNNFIPKNLKVSQIHRWCGSVVPSIYIPLN